MLASTGSEALGFGTLLAGVGTFIVGVVSLASLFLQKRNAAKAAVAHDVLVAVVAQNKKELKDHVTANRVQTMRYVDRQIAPLQKGQDTLLGLVAELEARQTISADNR